MTAMAVNRESVPWWVVLLQGIAAIIIGFFLVSRPAAGAIFLVQVLGWYWLITGIISLVMIFVDSTGWGWKLVIGILGIIAGLYIIRNPLQGTLVAMSTFVILVAIQGIIIGVINLIILWLLNALNISIAGGLLGAVINLVIAAAVLMLGSNIVSGVRTKGFVGALVAALAIAVVGWLIVLALGAVVPA